MALLRKLLRRTFYTAAALSTLLLLATLILWPVSYYRWVDATYGIGQNTQYLLGSQSGRAMVEYETGAWFPLTGLHFDSSELSSIFKEHWSYMTWNTRDRPMPATTSLGVKWDYFGPSPAQQYISCYVPLSYLALLFSILPLLALRSIRRRRKLARVGLCPKCNYDLRAHAIGEKCPECGTPVTKAAAGQPWSGGEAPAA